MDDGANIAALSSQQRVSEAKDVIKINFPSESARRHSSYIYIYIYIYISTDLILECVESFIRFLMIIAFAPYQYEKSSLDFNMIYITGHTDAARHVYVGIIIYDAVHRQNYVILFK
jgi:hypothetical protein